MPQVGCSPVVREPWTPVSAFLPPTALLHSGGAMPLRGFPRNTFPTVLPSQSKGLHRASFPGLVWYARMRYGQGDSATNAAASSWDAPSIAFGTFTSFAAWACRTPPSPHESTRQNAPLLTCTTCPRHPAQRACLKNLNGSFGPLPPRALWRPVETEHSPDSGGPIRPATRQSSCRA